MIPEEAAATVVEPEPEEEDLSPAEKFLATVEGDLFSDIVTRACVLDVILKKKLLTKAQVNQIVRLRPAIEKAEKVAMPVAIGACALALDDLDPEGEASPARDEIEKDAVETTTRFLEAQEKKRPTRSEKLGPLSYPLF